MTETVMATYLLLKGGGILLSVFPKDTTSKLPGFFHTISFFAERQA